MNEVKYKQVVMVVLDGLGVASPSEGNAVYAAGTPSLDFLINHYPATTLQACGPSVGLPWGERGNSEVGHLNLGAGRIVSQDLPRINLEIANGEFFKNREFLAAAEHVKKNNSKLHLAGLMSSGGVHSFDEHLFALLGVASDQGLTEVYIHVFTDGRDTPPKTALLELEKLARRVIEIGVGKIATVTGRFYAMDRGAHWELTEKAYRAMVFGEGEQYPSAREAIEANYAKQIFDETIPPTVITAAGKPVARVGDGDAVIFFNFRADRMGQIVRAFADPGLDKFSAPRPLLQNIRYVTLTSYDESFPVSVAFSPVLVKNGFAEVISANKLRQAHIAESEKFAHVTYFFNGGRHDPWPGEEREILSSPSSYERRYQDVPGMSVGQVADQVIAKLKSGTDFILANVANPDMLGHTGNKAACVKAIQAVDAAIGKIYKECEAVNACFVLTADHGNIEQLLDIRTGTIEKQHSLNPVPFLVAAKEFAFAIPRKNGYLELPAIVPEGVLSDAAPTILELFGIPKPVEMTAISLLPMLAEQVLHHKIIT